ncbi:hypothetical protein [Belliella pelovolcani]|uniref:hypothetical protein n=1 Tax=Belliella pelovolcani TaxID=529505 RepID=UPI0011159640|nr:hypothetical protein [Belliella pelovolcani]
MRPSEIWFWQSLLVSPATMTSADFLAHRNLVYSKISPPQADEYPCVSPHTWPKSLDLSSAISTTSALPPLRKVWTSV